ncbi:unnamed protein product [Closterium sp. Yama58-4]|nr:unnamed protein product [Closterium sp. Yama58-4]
MFLYQDLISGDALLSNNYRLTETQNGILYEVESQELPALDKDAFEDYVKAHIKKLVKLIPNERRTEFIAESAGAANWLISKLDDLKFFAGENMNLDNLEEGSLIYAYHKDGADNLTFVYFKDGLKKGDFF